MVVASLVFLYMFFSCFFAGQIKLHHGGLEAFSSFNAVRLQRAASISAFASPATLEFFGLFSVTTQIPSNAFAAPALVALIPAFAEPVTSRDAFAGKGDGDNNGDGAPPQPQIKVNLRSSPGTDTDLGSSLIGLVVVTPLFVIFSLVLVLATITPSV
uniref:Uncharacterized protein n=1 Tax=Nelumbo nucifera TaxID=4432 RepID=A0A822Z497_NELNU|nr:TPA_asm: hypothetical protein HUJ06_014205 [Nelumbo nucifera]